MIYNKINNKHDVNFIIKKNELKERLSIKGDNEKISIIVFLRIYKKEKMYYCLFENPEQNKILIKTNRLEKEQNIMEKEQNIMENEQNIMENEQNIMEKEQNIMEKEQNNKKKEQNIMEKGKKRLEKEHIETEQSMLI